MEPNKEQTYSVAADTLNKKKAKIVKDVYKKKKLGKDVFDPNPEIPNAAAIIKI